MSKTEAVNYFVVSKRSAFRELVRFVLEWQFQCEVFTSDSESAALEYLRSTQVFPNMIIYDYEPDAFLVEDFLVQVKESAKPVHFLVLADKIYGPTADWFETLSHFHLVPKNALWSEIFTLTRKSFAGQVQDNVEPWCRIHLDGWEALSGMTKDLFIKLSSGKMVRLFEGGSAGSEDMEKYRAKGLSFLWLERPTCDWIVEQIKSQFHIFLTNKQFQFVLRPPGASREEQFEQKILRVQEELHLDPAFRQEIAVLMDKVLEAVMKDVKLGNIVRLLRQGDPRLSYFTREMQLMSYVSCFLARGLEWHSKVTLEKLVYAAVLHDVTLATKPHLQRLTNLSQFEAARATLSEEEQKLYLQHPREAAVLLKGNFKFAPPETEVLVLQHHEMPDGTGFPGKIQADRLSPLVQLFVITHDFVHYVMNEPEPNLDIYFLRAEARFPQNSFRRYLGLLKKFRSEG
jgi:hypothetical protein